MHAIESFDLSVLPKQAQDELYDFYLFLKQRYQEKPVGMEMAETLQLSEQSLATDWQKPEEDEAWQAFQ